MQSKKLHINVTTSWISGLRWSHLPGIPTFTMASYYTCL